jgi:23S rRNA (pseudouridine1915-N3)-methyltransferase
MQITIAAIGKSKDSAEDALTASYLKRLPWKVDLCINDGRKLKNKAEETTWLMSQVHNAEKIIALDEHGKEYASKAFAVQLNAFQQQGIGRMAFLIGGADGLDKTQLPKSTEAICFGRMTWPHMLVRAMLAEQLYRAYTILTNHPYHRE